MSALPSRCPPSPPHLLIAPFLRQVDAAALQGQHLNIRTVKIEPFFYDKDTDSWNLDLLKELKKRGGFEYDLHYSEEGFDWKAAQQSVADGENDVFFGDFFVTGERLFNFDMTTPYMDVSLTMLQRYEPESLTKMMFSFLEPFDNLVWLMIAGLICWTSFVMWFLEGGLVRSGMGEEDKAHDVQDVIVPARKRKLFGLLPAREETRRRRGQRSIDSLCSNGRCSRSFYLSCTSFIGGGSHWAESINGRIYASIFTAVCLVIVCTYTGHLAASLSIKSKATTIEEFFEDGKVACANAYATAQKQFLQSKFKSKQLEFAEGCPS